MIDPGGLISTLPRAHFSRPCRYCQQPITLRRTVDGRWIPFEVDPEVVQVSQHPTGRGMVELLALSDQHRCRTVARTYGPD